MCVHGRRRYLPDLPILSIFEALPLYKLLKTGRVCPRFAQLQAEALANRKMLTIFIGENVDRKWTLYESELFFEPHLDTHTTREAEVEMAEFSALEMPNLNQESVIWLKNTFPRVTKLRLFVGEDNELSSVMVNVNQLLEQWAEKLESFGMWYFGWFDTDTYPIVFSSLFAVINEKLRALQYLTLAVDIRSENNSLNSSLHYDFSFLGRLKLFSTLSNPGELPHFLHHTSFENLPEIRLFGYNSQISVLKFPTRLAAKITALGVGTLGNQPADSEQLRALYGRLPALKWYRHMFDSVSNIGHFFIALSQLSHLSCLELSRVPFNSPERFHSQHELQPLSTLETLSIIGDIHGPGTHYLSVFGPLDRLFPALKTIKVAICRFIALDQIGLQINDQLTASAILQRIHTILQETVTVIMRTFAGLHLKGSLSVRQRFSDDFGHSVFYWYK